MDTFRKEYTPLNDRQKELVFQLKSKADELESLFENSKWELINMEASDKAIQEFSRAFALAQTNLQQSLFWAVYGVTTHLQKQV